MAYSRWCCGFFEKTAVRPIATFHADAPRIPGDAKCRAASVLSLQALDRSGGSIDNVDLPPFVNQNGERRRRRVQSPGSGFEYLRRVIQKPAHEDLSEAETRIREEKWGTVVPHVSPPRKGKSYCT